MTTSSAAPDLLGGCVRPAADSFDDRVPPVCPACGVKAKAPHYPPSLDVDQGEEPAPWWCQTCLRAKVHAAHRADCRCEGCARRAVAA